MKNISLNELAYELLETRRAYLKNTETLDIRLVYDWIKNKRAMLLKQKFDQPMYSIDDHYIQDLGNAISMVKVEANNIVPTMNDYNYLYRTSIEIPRTIEQKEGKGTFLRIGPADLTEPSFQITTSRKVTKLGNGKFNYNTIYAFVLGDYIYLSSKSGIHFTIGYIDVRGVFGDPVLAALIKDPTWTYNDDYPINQEIVDQMKSLIINDKFGLTLVQAQDKTDDLENNPEGNVNIPKRQTQSNS